MRKKNYDFTLKKFIMNMSKYYSDCYVYLNGDKIGWMNEHKMKELRKTKCAEIKDKYIDMLVVAVDEDDNCLTQKGTVRITIE